MSKLGKQLKTEDVLKGPRVTEKSSILMGAKAPAYVFEVTESANKLLVKKAIEEKYKVKPVSVNIINLPAKKMVRRGKRVSVSGARKAVVYLKAGDKIDL